MRVRQRRRAVAEPAGEFSVSGGVRRVGGISPLAYVPRILGGRLSALAPLVIIGLWTLTIQHIRLGQMTDIGLLSVLPLSTLGLLFLLTLSFAIALRQSAGWGVLLLHLVVLIIALYGITAFLEPVPRFSSVYRHVGIIDYILGHHSVNPDIDAYFNWPGFFALGGFLTKAAGYNSALPFAAGGSLVFNLLFLPPLMAILSWATDDARVKWLGAWVFYSCNWVGQDYVSPQALGFLLWLTILAVLLHFFTPRPTALLPERSFRAVIRSLDPRGPKAFSAAGPSIAVGQGAGVLLMLIGIYAAIVAGHQLTPVPAWLTVTALVIFAGARLRALPIIMLVGLAAWLSYMTTAWLVGHFGLLSGPVASLGSNLTKNVGARLAGSPDHQFIVNLRLLFSGAVLVLAAGGFLRRYMARRLDLALALVALTPMVLPIVQPYGGEMVLRVFLFALPATSFFIACLAFPTPSAGRSPLTTAGIVLVGCLLLLGFQYTRYGNERMDAFTPGDAGVVHALYRLAPRGSIVISADDNVPWRYRNYADYSYVLLTDRPEWQKARPSAAGMLAEVRRAMSPTGGYLIMTRSEQIEAELLYGRPHILLNLTHLLTTTPAARVIYRGGGGEIFYFRGVRPASASSGR